MSGKKVRSSVNSRKSQFKFSKLKFKFGRVYKDDVHTVVTTRITSRKTLFGLNYVICLSAGLLTHAWNSLDKFPLMLL